MNSYADFIQTKTQLGGNHGFEPLWMPDSAFDFQKSLIEWNCRKGRSADFADCGLGKTLIQLSFAENVVRKTNGRVLVLTPLAVKFAIEIDVGALHQRGHVVGFGDQDLVQETPSLIQLAQSPAHRRADWPIDPSFFYGLLVFPVCLLLLRHRRGNLCERRVRKAQEVWTIVDSESILHFGSGESRCFDSDSEVTAATSS